MKKNVNLKVNGRNYSLQIDVKDLLVSTIREQIGLTGTKEGCGTGECGACTVLIDGEPVNSCLYFTVRAEGKDILTIEGLRDGTNLHPLQQAFVDTAALQCGFCGSGMLLSAMALLGRHANPTEQEIRHGIAGNICRCTGYTKMIQAIKNAAVMMQQDGGRQ